MAEVQFTVVDTVPASKRPVRKSQWDEPIANVPDEGALEMEFETPKKAGNKAGSLRAYLKSREIEGLEVSRRGNKVYLAKAS